MPIRRSRRNFSKKRKMSRNRMRGGALDSLTSKHILGTPFDEDVEQGWKQNSFTDVSATGGLESVIVENTEDALRNTGVKMYKLIASPDNLTPGDVIAKSEQLDKYLRESLSSMHLYLHLSDRISQPISQKHTFQSAL